MPRPRPPAATEPTATAAPKSALDGISRSLPALAASQEMQERAANLGYDWPSIDGVLDKVREEVGELVEAEDDAHRAEELGDLLFVLVNVGRKTGIEVEGALRAANEKFRRPVPARGAVGRGARRRAARPVVRRAGRALGRREGGRARGGEGMSIGNRPPGRPRYARTAAPPADLRPIEITLGVQKWAEGSCMIRFGDTQVLCAATIEDRVPPHLRGKGTGWVTGTYEMLPRATAERSEREAAKGKIGGRTHEIQRLVGRSLRGVVDLSRLGERTVTVDCDVIVADGGTRTASITGGYVALAAALITYGMDRHLVGHVAAVSVGIIDGIKMLDLDYSEDSRAEVDFNVVGTDAGAYVELQGTAEGKPFDRAALDELLDLAGAGLGRLFEAQTAALATVRR